MDKTAQERSFLNKLREKTNLYGKSLEGFNVEFSQMMSRLRSTDERIRTHAEGVRDLIKDAQQQVNRRDYLTAAIDLTEFHKKCRYISAELDAFIKSIDTKNFKVLLDQFDDEQKKQLFGYNPDEEIKLDESSANDAPIEAQAGLLDVVHNLTTERGKAMRALEKNFSMSFLNDLKKNSYSMADKSARFLSFMLATFKKLGTALARRKIKQYVDLSKNFISKFRAYDTLFRKFYNDNIVPLKQQHEAIIEEQRKSEEAKAKAIEDATAKRMQEVQRQEKFQESGKQQFLESAINAPQTSIPSVTPTENMPIPLSKQKAANFIVSLEKIALLNNPNQLVSQILAFSAELEDSNPDMSLKLIAIVEGIVNEYQIG